MIQCYSPLGEWATQRYAVSRQTGSVQLDASLIDSGTATTDKRIASALQPHSCLMEGGRTVMVQEEEKNERESERDSKRCLSIHKDVGPRTHVRLGLAHLPYTAGRH